MTKKTKLHEQVRKAEEDGVFLKVNKLVSGAFLLMTIAQMFYDDAGDKLRDYGLLLGRDKQNFNRVITAMSNYTGQFVHNFMEGSDRKEVNASFAEDFDKYLPKIIEMLELENDYN